MAVFKTVCAVGWQNGTITFSGSKWISDVPVGLLRLKHRGDRMQISGLRGIYSNTVKTVFIGQCTSMRARIRYFRY